VNAMATRSVARLEDGLDALTPVPGDGLTVKDRGRDGPADVVEPGQAWKVNYLRVGQTLGWHRLRCRVKLTHERNHYPGCPAGEHLVQLVHGRQGPRVLRCVARLRSATTSMYQPIPEANELDEVLTSDQASAFTAGAEHIIQNLKSTIGGGTLPE
jgi:hypothetical protein